MVDRELRYTLSAAAWVGAFLCGLALMTSAIALASNVSPAPAAPVASAGAAQP